MSGGLYGVSTELAQLLSECPYYKAHARGIEDVTFGKAVKACVPENHPSPLQLLGVDNGDDWCHSKAVRPHHVRFGRIPAGCAYG